MPSKAALERKGLSKVARRAPATVAPAAALPLGKQLSHTDKTVRDQAIANLAAFLSRGGQGDEEEADVDMEEENGATEKSESGYVRLSDSEMAKLWKGLFYCFWMSDKPLVQQSLATELSGLMLRINPRPAAGKSRAAARLDAALAFNEGFWVAIVREWSGIDRLRMDKYYMLIRRWVAATFRLLARSEFSEESISALNATLMAPRGPLSWQDRRVPTSLATHLADVYLSELDKVLAEGQVGKGKGKGESAAPLVHLLEPFIALLANTPSQVVHTRLMNVLFAPLLASLAVGAKGDMDEDDDEDEDEQAYPAIAAHSCTGSKGKAADPAGKVRAALLSAMFTTAAAESAVESNRRKIYKVVREEGDDDEDDE